MIARKIAAVAMAFIVLAVITTWTPSMAYPVIIGVLTYGVLCAALGIWVYVTIRTHWK